MKQNILIITYSPIYRDPRVLRQIETYQPFYNIETMGVESSNIKGIIHYNIEQRICKNFFERIKKAFGIIFCQYEKVLDFVYNYNHIKTKKILIPNMIVANDWNGLYLTCRLKEFFNWKAKIYFDAHEYFPKYREDLFWKIFEKPLVNYVLKKYQDSFVIMSTVCSSLARKYDQYYNFAPNTVRVITNAPDYEPTLLPQPVGDMVRIIHHGGAMRVRQLEKMIDMMAYLPENRYELYFMLVLGEKDYYDYLVHKASGYNNVHFLEPVPFSQIPSFINRFDIGIFILNNDLISYKYALPNKFFEFIQARLAIAIGDSYEMKQYLKKYDLGITAKANTAKAMANELLKISKDDVMRYKHNAHNWARELSSETNMVELKKIAEELID